MSELELIKSLILAKYPSIKSLSVWRRFVARLEKECDPINVETYELNKDRFSVTYRTHWYGGKEYFRKFGEL